MTHVMESRNPRILFARFLNPRDWNSPFGFHSVNIIKSPDFIEWIRNDVEMLHMVFNLFRRLRNPTCTPRATGMKSPKFVINPMM